MARTRTITFFEHEKKPASGSQAVLTDRELDQLEKINYVQRCDFFKFHRHYIQATKYVGFIKINNKTNIQVVPKICKDDADANLHFLFYLLKYTKKLELKDFSTALFKKFDDSFFEVLIRLFAKNLNDKLQHDMKKSYVFIEENSRFLKGKLLLSEQLKYNITNKAKLFCCYNEFTENNLLNQVLKNVTNCLFKVTDNSYNRKLLQQNLMLMADVDLKAISLSDTEKIHLNRLNFEYKPLLDLCKLFLSRRTATFQIVNLETFAFMFDLEKLFEEFIYEFMLRHRLELGLKTVKAQKYFDKLFFKEFKMKYDILAKDLNNKEVLIDTKYKLLDKDKIHHGLSQADFYQMFAYSQSQDKKYDDVLLLYPKKNCGTHHFEHIVDNHRIKLAVRGIDLESIWDDQKRVINETDLLEDIKQCLN